MSDYVYVSSMSLSISDSRLYQWFFFLKFCSKCQCSQTVKLNAVGKPVSYLEAATFNNLIDKKIYQTSYKKTSILTATMLKNVIDRKSIDTILQCYITTSLETLLCSRAKDNTRATQIGELAQESTGFKLDDYRLFSAERE